MHMLKRVSKFKKKGKVSLDSLQGLELEQWKVLKLKRAYLRGGKVKESF